MQKFHLSDSHRKFGNEFVGQCAQAHLRRFRAAGRGVRAKGWLGHPKIIFWNQKASMQMLES